MPSGTATRRPSTANWEKVQLTEADLARLSRRNTPLADWPDEDVDALFGPPAE